MTPYMKFLHIWSVNIILLMFIFGAIGYIFNEQKNKQIITPQLLKYYHIMLIIAVITGVAMIVENIFWLRFPIFQYKLFITTALVLLSIFHLKLLPGKSNIRSIITILMIISIYSVSMIIGFYTYG